VAEELAMLDVMSNGRLVAGMLRGTANEYVTYATNPAESRERFEEGWEIIRKGWVAEEPFDYHGKYWNLDYVAFLPRPLQQPIPETWIPSISAESMEWAAKNRICLAASWSPTDQVSESFEYYRRYAKEHCGWSPGPEHCVVSRDIYVAETNAKAREEAGRHVETLFNKFLRLPFQMLFPPGYLSAKSLKNMLTHKRSVAGQEHTVDTLIEQGIILCGSPDTVRKQLMDTHRLLGFQNFLALLQFATLPRDLTEKNIRLFASEVLPTLQSLTDKEYAGMQTQAAE